MNLKANFELTEGSYMSPQGFVSMCANVLGRDMNNVTSVSKVYHVHLSGIPGAGKSRIATQIAAQLEAALNAEVNRLSVKLMHFDQVGRMKEEKWITNLDAVNDAVETVISEADRESKKVLIISEGVSDNMDYVLEYIDHLGVFDLSLCCIVEPSVSVFSRAMKMRAKESVNFAHMWKERASWTYSRAEKFIHDSTMKLFNKTIKDALSYQDEGAQGLRRPVILLYNHALSGNGSAWFSAMHSDLMEDILYKFPTEDDE